jgi:hypothetical protein
MKKKDVPQDEGLMDGRFEDVCYALDEDGNYVPVLSAGWEPKNQAMRQAWEAIEEEIEEARQKVLSGQVSPVYFFMVKNMMNVKLLSEYAGIPKRKVKQHLKPGQFAGLEEETLQRYAEAFNISTDRLTNFKELQDKNEQK